MKKKLLKILCYIILPFIIYAIVTLILCFVRGKSFAAYHVNTENKQYILYHDVMYEEITEHDQVDYIIEEMDVKWNDESEILTSAPVKFPYLEYWFPQKICDHLKYSEDGEYLLIYYVWKRENAVYQRVEE